MSRWENIGDKYLLNALGDDPLAAQQSVAMYLDPIAKCIEWHTNGHVIRLRPDLPSAVVSGPFPTSFGYEWNLAGGLVFGVGDVSLTKRAGILDLWGLEGVQLYYIVPVGQIPNTPTVTIEKIDILDGMIDQLDLAPQGILSAAEIALGSSRVAPWGDNSMVLSWADKRNNNAADDHSNYMAGKILHEAPPVAHPLVCPDLQAGNTSNRSFGAANGSETTGWYETLLSGFQKAYNLQDLIDRRGVGTHYAFAATLGQTAFGGSTQTSQAIFGASFSNVVGANDIVDFNIGLDSPGGGSSDINIGVFDWNGSTVPTGNVLANSAHTEIAASFSVGNQWWTHTYAGTPTIDAAGKCLGSSLSSPVSGQRLYDSSGGQLYYAITGYVSPLPSPWSATSSLGWNFSHFITVTPSGAGSIIPQIMHHRQQQRSA